MKVSDEIRMTPGELKVGDYVTVHSINYAAQLPQFPPNFTPMFVNVQKTPEVEKLESMSGMALEVTGICLPFIAVKVNHYGLEQMVVVVLDTRKVYLQQINKEYAMAVMGKRTK